MARKTEITSERVAAAAEKLIAEGRSVTNKSVLAEIGSGSMSTLVPLLSAWKAGQEEQQELAELDVPDTLAVAAEGLISKVWKSAMTEATAGHEALRKELLAAQAAVEEVRGEMLELLREAESQLDQSQEHAQGLADELDAVRLKLEKAEARATEAELNAARMTERVSAAEASQNKAEQDRDAARSEIAKVEAVAKETIAAAEARSSKADARADKAEARADKADERVVGLQEELSKTQADLGSARSDLSVERAQHVATREKLTERLERLSADFDNSESARTAVEAELKATTSERDETIAEIEAVRKERDAATAASSEMAVRMAKLEEALKAAEAKSKAAEA